MEVNQSKNKLHLYEYYNIDSLRKENLEEYFKDPYNFKIHRFSFDHIIDS